MQEDTHNRHLNKIIAIFFILAFIAGFVSFPIDNMPHLQEICWAVAALFNVLGSAVMASKLTRERQDIAAAGYNILAIGNVMIYGFIVAGDTGTGNYSGSIVLYVPGLALISFYTVFPLLLRALSMLAAIGFAVLSVLLLHMSQDMPIVKIISAVSYISFNFAMLGWAWNVYRGTPADRES